MKIAKMIPMNYTIVYVEDGGKYSAYKRHSAEEWIGSDGRKASAEKAARLEELFEEESKKR